MGLLRLGGQLRLGLDADPRPLLRRHHDGRRPQRSHHRAPARPRRPADGRDLRNRHGELVGRSGNYYALVAREVGSSTRSGLDHARHELPAPCRRGAPAEWVLLDQTGAPHMAAPGVAFTTPAGDDPGAAPGDVLGVCEAGGIVDHYRGHHLRRQRHGWRESHRQLGSHRVVPTGVVPRESPASWGAAGGGAGTNALRAQAVAARSYALTQARYSYAKTCDSSACQVYGGAAGESRRRRLGRRRRRRARAHRPRDRRDRRQGPRWPATARIVSTEFSASNGPRTAGGSFPAVDDPADDVPANPLTAGPASSTPTPSPPIRPRHVDGGLHRARSAPARGMVIGATASSSRAPPVRR